MTANTRTVPGIDSYAPQVEIKVGGQAFPLDDVIDLRVTLQQDDVGGFTMQLANHFNLKTQRFRHSDFTHLDIGKRVEIRMGYAAPNRMQPMLTGEITSLAPSFPSSGMPTLTVSGTDPLNRLRRNKPGPNTAKSFFQVRDWEIAQRVAERNHLGWSQDSTTDGQMNPVVNQRDLDDLRFVLSLAKRNDFEATTVLEDGGAKLYFGPPRDRRGSQAVTEIPLTWGQSLVSFHPHLSTGLQVSRVTVRGWDRNTKQPIVGTATIDELKAPGKGRSAAEILEANNNEKVERIVDRAVQSLDEAKALAKQLLAETAYLFLTGSGETIGNPEIRPLTNLKLTGLGTRYDGVYYVTRADHTYGASGYLTSFEVKRMREGA